MLYGSSGCSHLKNIFLLFMAVIHTAFSHFVDRGVFCLGVDGRTEVPCQFTGEKGR